MNRVQQILHHLGGEGNEVGTRVAIAHPTAGNGGDDVVIVSACRTAMGSFGGKLSSVSATTLGAHVMKGALAQAGAGPEGVDEVFMGNVLSANLGQAPARQSALAAGIPNSVPCTTINKVCSSGLKAVMLGAQAIELGDAKCVMAAGAESMSNVPYYLARGRFGMRFGAKGSDIVDGLSYDGLTDPYDNVPMGKCGEVCSRDYTITREQQDAYAEQSYRRAAGAQEAGHFKAEIVPITVKVRRKEVTVAEDEECSKINFESMRKLRPSFDKEGTITAANASAISDGAAACVLMSTSAARERGCRPMARILATADAAKAPVHFTTAPELAIRKALAKANLQVNDVDLWEINEAFSVVALVNAQLLDLDMSRVNVNGGAVSLGHPLGASGCRILVTLLHALKARGGKIGVAAICNGGGGASCVVVECL